MIHLLDKAASFGRKKHEGQLDDDGKPYFEHCCQVVDILKNVTDDEDIIAAAYLHDTIEDCNVTYNEIKEKFGEKIADLVLEVTHDDYRDKGHTFPRLHSKEGIMIKFADRLSNISRMQPWDKERQEHYLRRSKFWKSSLDDVIIEGQKKPL